MFRSKFPDYWLSTVVPRGYATENGVSGITGYADNLCMICNGTIYAGNEDVVKLTFSHYLVGCTVKKTP